MAKKLMKGCEAIGEAAIQAGCRLFFGYPITPQNEIPEYMARRLPDVGGTFVQAESEVAASNMIYGAAAAGCRVLTSSSSPGISLMQEAISYLAGAELPAVLVNIMRAGPGLGGILPSQADYFQSVKTGGHGDYHLFVLAPSSVQEAADLMQDAFDLADRYRNPVLVLGDGLIGQMMEPVEFKTRPQAELPPKTWAANGCRGRAPNIVNSLYLDPEECERVNRRIGAKYALWREREVRHSGYNLEAAYELLIVAYGTVARVCQTAIDDLKAEGLEVGLFRPVTLFPFPTAALKAAAARSRKVLVVELNLGQCKEDVDAIVQGTRPVEFYGRQGGMMAAPEDVVREVKRILQQGSN
jgi:2-oxoglutarate ferredoxin oxidoreductase subunit alpha